MTDQLEALKVALADRYLVEREVGSGGMAVVYLARDTKHDRDVAVKVLHPELAASIGTDRFLREIRITAGLQHPHILPLYNSGEAGGFLYYVMPFVEGETLDHVIAREGQLPIREAVRYVREAAEALAYAHGHGLIHRDIKPGNIFISGGHAVLADFGIARALEEAGTEKITQTGTAVGTPTYMSPEQATGQSNVDARSDIYSLGCVLYEVLVGQVPFTGPTPMAVMARHSVDHVPPPHIMRDTVSAELEEVIYRCMAKSPADRYRTAAEMAEALKDVQTSATGTRHRSPVVGWTTEARTGPWRSWRRSWVPASGAVVALALVGLGWAMWPRGGGDGPGFGLGDMDPRRVAVLYFEDLSGGALDHVADGLTEGLIDELARVRTLDVVSRGGVAPYRNGEVPRDSIARALRAGSLVQGSLEPVGTRVRVTARLVDGTSGVDVQRASFELPEDQLLAVQDSLVQEVARLLRTRLGEEIRLQERRGRTASVEAWTLFHRAERLRKEAETLLREDDLSSAAAAFARADSSLAMAESADTGWLEPIVERAWVAYRRSRLERGLDGAPWLEEGLDHVGRVVERTPNHPGALAARGTLRYRLWELRADPDPAALNTLLRSAQRDLESAVAADPSLARANIILSYLYYQIDDVPGAMLAARRAYEEDAYLEEADVTLIRLFWGSLDLEQFSEARRWCTEGARRFAEDSRFVQCQLWLMVTPALAADPDRAWQLLERLERLTPAPARDFVVLEARMLTAGALARAGLADSARSVLTSTREQITHDVDPHQELLGREAYVRVLMGDHDRAIDLLKQYVAANPGHPFAETAGTVWWWREIRNHPRFHELSQPGR